MVGGAWDWVRRKRPLVDCFFASPLLLMTVPGIYGGRGGIGPWEGAALIAGLLGPMALRRTLPRTTFAAVALVSFVQWAAGLNVVPANAAVLMGLYTVAAGPSFRWGLAALAVTVVGAAMAAARYISDGDQFRYAFLMLAGMALGVWLLGLHMRTRRQYLRSLEERAERLERERETEVRIAMAAERARIARELHDVVAHNVSVIVVQADGAWYAMEGDPARARRALEAISTTGRQALTEMRRLLGVLREGGEAEPSQAAAPEPPEGAYAPQPGVDQLGDLVEKVRAAGLPVEFDSEGTPPEMSQGRELTVFRIVQEALTNTLKHGGPHATARVRLRYGADALEIEVTDDGRGAAAADDGRGHGLAGMRERVAVYGGHVRAGPRPGGGFEVVAKIPLREEVRT
ncbi:two-component sensor histidine kinase [Actinomadura sp. NBRC 104425]|uniref:sensor histidine kinase n=1 Tax=Actinomadura sp. NBRC 104425 TaxID=3032204 RepID=UPI0024A3BB56|nr:sensor histidine kinase [Actinomadura sp. NBRC 104425]GLZ15367.1 two-component sensor histidine kinase [Actinomadura sp. NBRC 104425]